MSPNLLNIFAAVIIQWQQLWGLVQIECPHQILGPGSTPEAPVDSCVYLCSPIAEVTKKKNIKMCKGSLVSCSRRTTPTRNWIWKRFSRDLFLFMQKMASVGQCQIQCCSCAMVEMWGKLCRMRCANQSSMLWKVQQKDCGWRNRRLIAEEMLRGRWWLWRKATHFHTVIHCSEVLRLFRVTFSISWHRAEKNY